MSLVSCRNDTMWLSTYSQQLVSGPHP